MISVCDLHSAPHRRRCPRTWAQALALILVSTVVLQTAALAATPSAASGELNDVVADASRRFGLPASWIWAVIHAESGGDPRAVSRVGAMGLMQIMPKTWRDLRRRHGLGADPFEPRDNVLAGAAYLHELFDRYGTPGFLAAYNAGPGRYEDALDGGATLPLETQDYLAKLTPLVGGATAAPSPSAPDPWRSSLFAPGASAAQALAPVDATRTSPPTSPPFQAPPSTSLFPGPFEPEAQR